MFPTTFRNNLGRLIREPSGNISMMATGCIGVAVTACAFAVDLGSVSLERRQAQAAVDLAAIAAVADLDRAEAAAAATIAANGITGLTALKVTRGHYEADPTLGVAQRFVAGATPTNAVSVSISRPGRLFFAKALRTPVTISVQGLATNSSQATFSIGSRLLAVRDGLPNALLKALIGGNISLSVSDYNALIGADVKLASFLTALASEVHVTAGTYNDVLQSHATVGDILSAMATVMR